MGMDMPHRSVHHQAFGHGGGKGALSKETCLSRACLDLPFSISPTWAVLCLQFGWLRTWKIPWMA